MPKAELCDDYKEQLDIRLSQMQCGDMVTVVYFSEDNYVRITGILSKIKLEERWIQVVRTKIYLDDIYEFEKIRRCISMSALFYTTPSHGDWNRALPIGNGKLGAMIFGEGTGEHFQLNEDSVWFGQKRNRNNPDALANLDTIRRYIFEGKIEKAEELCKYALAGTRRASTRIRHWEMSTSITVEN